MPAPPDNTVQHTLDPQALARRQALRRDLLAAREALAAQTRRQAALTVERHLRARLAAQPPARVGFCAAVRGEIDLAGLVAGLLDAGWTACMPVVEQARAPMVFHQWTPQAPMCTDRHGIPIPATPRCAAPDLLLIPVLGVDRAGHRLGYGGGYFDRTLAALAAQGKRPLCIGVGHDAAWIDDLIPAPHDMRLDAFVGPSGFFSFAQDVC